MFRYTDIVMDHFANPRHLGTLEAADGVGEAGCPEDGDVVTVSIRVAADTLAEVVFQAVGCPAAIAAGSVTAQLATGKTIEEAKAISNAEIESLLGGLPPGKSECSNLGADALHLAILDYEAGHGAFAKDLLVDCRGLRCPLPIATLSKRIKAVNAGVILEVVADDDDFTEDLQAWCRMTGNECVRIERRAGEIRAFVKKA